MRKEAARQDTYGVNWLNISVKTANVLIAAGIVDIDKLMDAIEDGSLVTKRGVGPKTVTECITAVRRILSWYEPLLDPTGKMPDKAKITK